MDFAFNASALGVGGVIERGNVITTIPSIASVALAPTGGEGRSVVSNYFSEELEFTHAETRVFGRRHLDAANRPAFTTQTYVLMKGVRLFDKLRIAEMSSTVTSTRGLDDGDDHDFEISVSYRGVQVNGREIGPRVDLGLKQLRRYDDLVKRFPQGRAGATPENKELAQRFNATPDQLSKLLHERKPIQGSLIAAIEGLSQRQGSPTIFIPGIGIVRFGELMLKPGRRRLNLLRIEFGPKRPNDERDARIANEEREARMADDEALDERNDAMGSGTGPTGGSMTMGSGEGNGTPIGP